MSVDPVPALLTLSIDLELDLEQQGKGFESRLETATSQLLRILETFRIAATWSVADPAVSAATGPILRSILGHELAVLGETSWAGPGAGRLRFARELNRRISTARAAGVDVNTLTLRHTEIGGNLDVLVQSGIRVLRRGRIPTMTSVGTPTELAYPGLLDAPLSARIPSFSRWDWTAGRRQVQRLIESAIQLRGNLHLVIDGAQLVNRLDRSLASITKLLTFCVSQRDHETLELITLREYGDRFLPSTAAIRSHSILRPAA